MTISALGSVVASAPVSASSTSPAASSSSGASAPASGSAAIAQAEAAAASSTTSQLLTALEGGTTSDSSLANVAAESELWHGLDVLA